MAVTVAVLVAAVLHAGWNALLKGVGDRLATVVLLDLTGLVVAAVAVPLVPAPAPASRGLLVASVVLHLGYELLLLVAYRGGVCAGLLALAGAGRGARWWAAVGPALATGVFIAAYTVADGLGVRRAGTATGYVAWLFLLHGLPIPLYALAARHPDRHAGVRRAVRPPPGPGRGRPGRRDRGSERPPVGPTAAG